MQRFESPCQLLLRNSGNFRGGRGGIIRLFARRQDVVGVFDPSRGQPENTGVVDPDASLEVVEFGTTTIALLLSDRSVE